MDKSVNLALIMQMIEAAEKNIQTAKQLLRESGVGSSHSASVASHSFLADRLASVNSGEGGKVIEGVFDGQNMIGPNEKQYPVPANYASKSKLVEGDVLKLTIAEDGSFIYKQIGPVERRKMIGVLLQDEKGDYKVIAEGKTFKVLLASLTYYKAEAGDEVTIVVPEAIDSEWAAVEHVIKQGSAGRISELEAGGGTIPIRQSNLEEDVEMSEEGMDAQSVDDLFDSDDENDSELDSPTDSEESELSNHSGSAIEARVSPKVTSVNQG